MIILKFGLKNNKFHIVLNLEKWKTWEIEWEIKKKTVFK